MRLIPKTKIGWWSVGLIVIMPICFFMGMRLARTVYLGVISGRTIPEDLIGRPFLFLVMLLGMGCGVGGLITGLWAILTKKDRGVLVYISTLVGGLFSFFLLGEIGFLH